MKELSIIIPCRNDALLLPQTIQAVHEVVTYNSLSVETLIVDDDSSDETLEVSKALAIQYPALHIRVLARKRLLQGFGTVVRYGLAFAKGRYCVLVSADGQDPVELLPEFTKHLRAGKHLVQCTRYNSKEHADAVPMLYRLYQAIYRGGVRILLATTIRDSTYGFRAFDRCFIQALGTSSRRFNICPEITLKTLLCGGDIHYVPGSPRPFRHGGPAKFKLPNEIMGYAYVLFRAALHRTGIVRWF